MNTLFSRSLWILVALLSGATLAPTATAERIRALSDSAIESTATSPEHHSANVVHRRVSLMTTTVDFHIALPNTQHTTSPAGISSAEGAISAAVEEIERITRLMSEWEPDSEISRMNQAAGQQAVVVSAEVFRLISEAVRIADISHGKFDITFKSAGKLWDFRTQVIPTEKQLSDAVSAINYHHIELNPEQRSVFLKHTNTRIGLGGIAKGYAIDRAAQIIRQAGFDVFYINAGGDLYASSGQHAEKRWQVGIQHPDDAEQLIAMLPVANAAVATSGDYERYFEHDGVRYHHIIDPDTGHPARLSRSATVLTSRAYLADALATAVFVLGPERGLALIHQLPEAEAMIIGADGEVYSTLPD
ncbi:FAD:protein FMN transferase [Thalassolituus sp.]|uniref:FAD:protein FMN transferase n=1 Tax=Thalassolituus sp. TaxID=2030822 RepID=UPI0035166E31